MTTRSSATSRRGAAAHRRLARDCRGPEVRPGRIRDGTLFALREAYDLDVVAALTAHIEKSPDAEAVRTLAGLLRKPAPWDGRWWRNGP